MKPKLFALVFTCIAVASLLLSCTPAQPVIPITGNEAMMMPARTIEVRDQALKYIAENYKLPTLVTIAWQTCRDVCLDTGNAEYRAFTNKPETISELQAQYAIDPQHSVYTTAQWTVIVNEPHDALSDSRVTVINAENNVVWSGMVDVNGNVTEVKAYKE